MEKIKTDDDIYHHHRCHTQPVRHLDRPVLSHLAAHPLLAAVALQAPRPLHLPRHVGPLLPHHLPAALWMVSSAELHAVWFARDTMEISLINMYWGMKQWEWDKSDGRAKILAANVLYGQRVSAWGRLPTQLSM